MTPRCDLTELPVDQCAHCLGHAEPLRDAAAERAQLLERPGWFPARFGGMCERCGERFEQGTPIRMNITRGWRGACCADEPFDGEPAGPGRRAAQIGRPPRDLNQATTTRGEYGVRQAEGRPRGN